MSCEDNTEFEGYVAPPGTPEIAKFGTSVERMLTRLKSLCFELSPPTPSTTLSVAGADQVAVSCHLIEYYGAERNAEFIFLHNELVYVRFDLDFEDVAYRIEEKRKEFGNPDFNNDKAAFFRKGGVVINKKKPAAIYFAKTIDNLIDSSFRA